MGFLSKLVFLSAEAKDLYMSLLAKAHKLKENWPKLFCIMVSMLYVIGAIIEYNQGQYHLMGLYIFMSVVWWSVRRLI